MEVGSPEHERYAAAILRELAARAGRFPGRLVSIYLGGGTPSLWRPACVAEVIAAIRRTYGAEAAPVEITLETNPTDCSEDNLAAWRSAGVNRVSIGVQSLAPDELVTLGRDHRFGDGLAALDRVLATGAFTVSCDFILGTPPHGRPGWIDAITSRPVDHLSVYELTIEERTAFGARVRSGRLTPLDEEALTDLYTHTHEALTARGFEHYEISSYARPGKRAVHNALYWRGTPFLGLGVGAASLQVGADGGGERATNPRTAEAYLAAPGVPAEVVRVGPAEMASDRLWLGMRTSDGVPEEGLPGEIVRWLIAEGLAERRADRMCPTLRGFLMADRIAARIAQAL